MYTLHLQYSAVLLDSRHNPPPLADRHSKILLPAGALPFQQRELGSSFLRPLNLSRRREDLRGSCFAALPAVPSTVALLDRSSSRPDGSYVILAGGGGAGLLSSSPPHESRSPFHIHHRPGSGSPPVDRIELLIGPSPPPTRSAEALAPLLLRESYPIPARGEARW